jgi:hypothetical protein
MEILINVLAIAYAVELSVVAFLIGYTAKDTAPANLDPYEAAQMAKIINMGADWEECYRAALVLKQAGLTITYIDCHRFAGYSEEECQLADWRTEETEEMPHENYGGLTAEQFSTALANAFHLIRVQTVTSKERN